MFKIKWDGGDYSPIDVVADANGITIEEVRYKLANRVATVDIVTARALGVDTEEVRYEYAFHMPVLDGVCALYRATLKLHTNSSGVYDHSSVDTFTDYHTANKAVARILGMKPSNKRLEYNEAFDHNDLFSKDGSLYMINHFNGRYNRDIAGWEIVYTNVLSWYNPSAIVVIYKQELSLSMI